MEEEINVIKAYGNIFNRKEGKLVKQDLVSAFHMRDNPEVEKDLAEIPHPYREYVVKGQRDVVLRILALADNASEIIATLANDNTENP